MSGRYPCDAAAAAEIFNLSCRENSALVIALIIIPFGRRNPHAIELRGA
jgi:hypothetical protein